MPFKVSFTSTYHGGLTTGFGGEIPNNFLALGNHPILRTWAQSDFILHYHWPIRSRFNDRMSQKAEMHDGKIADNQTVRSMSFRVKSPIISKPILALLPTFLLWYFCRKVVYSQSWTRIPWHLSSKRVIVLSTLISRVTNNSLILTQNFGVNFQFYMWNYQIPWQHLMRNYSIQ